MNSPTIAPRSEEHTSELQSRVDLVCRLRLEKKNGCSLRGRASRLDKPGIAEGEVDATRRQHYAGAHGDREALENPVVGHPGRLFYFEKYGEHQHLHSFPTRRSSD